MIKTREADLVNEAYLRVSFISLTLFRPAANRSTD